MTNNVSSVLLDVRNLSISFEGLNIVRGIDFCVEAGEVLGIVGESGSGKSLSMLGLLGLIEKPGVVKADRIKFDRENLLDLNPRQRRKILGNDIGIVFQDPLSSLNPSYTVGSQIAEVLRFHKGIRGSELKKQVLILLDRVGIPDSRNRINAFPHQLSGGMNQRVMIAMAIACEPKLLIADEPTTALDVTIQAQVMQLLRTLQREQNMALILISHDLAVVAEIADRVVVMYAGEAIENNFIPEVFDSPRHPYTAALLAAMPENNRRKRRLFSLLGAVPSVGMESSGCLFAARCQYVVNSCLRRKPPLAWPARSIKVPLPDTARKVVAPAASKTIKIESARTDCFDFLGGTSLVRCIRSLNRDAYKRVSIPQDVRGESD